MLKKILLILMLIWLVFMALFYFSCKKSNTAKNSFSKEALGQEIPEFRAITFSPQDCLKYSDLQILKTLFQKEISEITYTLNNLNRLETLYINGLLTNRQLGVIPEQTLCFTQLKELGLTHQGITSLDTYALWNLKHLELLVFLGNAIPITEKNIADIKKLERLKVLYLDGRPLSPTIKQEIKNKLKNVQIYF